MFLKNLMQTLRKCMQALSAMLHNSQRPVVVCGTDTVGLSVINLAADLALKLQSGKRRTGLFYVLPGANSYGAALAVDGGPPFSGILDAIENGTIKALILVETDPLFQSPDPERVKNALGKLECLLVLDYLANRTILFIEQAFAAMDASAPMCIIFPTLTHFETRSSFINQEGRLQRAIPVHAGGLPLSQLTDGSHPPREFRNDIPGAGAKAAWRILSELEGAILSSQPAVSSYHDLWSRIGPELNVPVENGLEIPGSMHIIQKNTAMESGKEIAGRLPDTTCDSSGERLPSVSFERDELSAYSVILERVESLRSIHDERRDAPREGIDT